MQRKWVLLAAGAMITTMLTGCMDRQGEVGNRNIRGNSVRYDGNGNAILNKRFANDQMNEMNRMNGMRLNSNNLVGLHKNYRLEMSKDASVRLESLKEIGKAYVMLTDNNAYVAVTLNKGTLGSKSIHSESRTPNRPISRTNQAYMRPDMKDGNRIYDLDNKSYPKPLNYDLQSHDKHDPMKGMHKLQSMNGYTNNNDGMNGLDGNNNRYGSAITKHSPASEYDLNGVRSSSNQHAIQSLEAHTGDVIPTVLKEKIVMEIKKLVPQIDHVYVSANSDFVSRMASYMEDVKLGHPIQGFITEFNAMVERIFPVK
ncbi:hypothetical protein Back11_00530 [Paenibacillus baekrokdamisoli]|uniref:Uncharacterized protein n=1 Tax=Paenibacillus baekrokdamisoli TaxID=1712516 RepID=A0A3G9J4W3_9BACL|nr:YhcN/YlaJ family sporulation lipoprotein [Paenibacillus baekrokdamisoli]MBB3069322.1 hypothetical protein [Paenibacillus baekrokdamisoli]BBH18708.1 hypothetical protein Back11_00530 [Paenibacillus baekrokdamisoli]